MFPKLYSTGILRAPTRWSRQFYSPVIFQSRLWIHDATTFPPKTLTPLPTQQEPAEKDAVSTSAPCSPVIPPTRVAPGTSISIPARQSAISSLRKELVAANQKLHFADRWLARFNAVRKTYGYLTDYDALVADIRLDSVPLSHTDPLFVRCARVLEKLSKEQRYSLIVDSKITPWSVRRRKKRAYACHDGTIGISAMRVVDCETDDMLAFVLAHELAHIIRNHAIIKYPVLSLQLRRRLLAELVSSTMPSYTIDRPDIRRMNLGVILLLAAIGGPSLFRLRKLQRKHEVEADQLALSMMIKAGFDVKGSIMYLEMVERECPTNPAGFQFLSTHPTSAVRISNLRRWICDSRHEIETMEQAKAAVGSG